MLRGLSVSVEMNGDFILDTGDMLTRPLVVSAVHCTVTFTLVSTVSGSVTVQFRVCEVPSYSGPLGTLRVRFGVGTVWRKKHIEIYFMTETVETALTTLTADIYRDSLRCGVNAIDCCR